MGERIEAGNSGRTACPVGQGTSFCVEYRWEVVDYRSTRELDQLGDEGWRVVLGFFDPSRHEVRLLFERLLDEPDVIDERLIDAFQAGWRFRKAQEAMKETDGG